MGGKSSHLRAEKEFGYIALHRRNDTSSISWAYSQ